MSREDAVAIVDTWLTTEFEGGRHVKRIAMIDAPRPDSRAALARIPGLGPAKIDRFGDDILALVRRHAAG